MLDMAAIGEADATDSPEIGPPPVSKFVDEDPVKIDLPTRTRPQPSEDTSSMNSSLSINLEQRRKRKDSGGSSESRRSSQTELIVEETNTVESVKPGARSDRPEPVAEVVNSVSNVKAGTRLSRPDPVMEESTAQGVAKIGGRSGRFQSVEENISSEPIIKAEGPSFQQEPMMEGSEYVAQPKGGARQSRQEPVVEMQSSTSTVKIGGKRKLSVREDEENQMVARFVESPDDFKFTRVTQEEKTKNSVAPLPERSVAKAARGAIRMKPSEPLLPTTRRVLAPKSVNNSPRKAGKAISNDDSKPNKPDAPRYNHTRDRRERRQDPVQIKLLEAPIVPSEDIGVQSEQHLEPETPASMDLFSPQSSQPSTTRESRDTPPPSEFEAGNEGQRPSRRARGAVSYAEPNLRDKMRRPTKDLTDAVARDDKTHHRAGSVKQEEGVMCMDVKIKEEPKDDWNEMPAASSATVEGSPLRCKASLSDSLPSSITTHRKRRESLLNQAEPENHVAGSGTAIAALLAETRKVKAAVREKGKEIDRAHSSDAITNGMSKMEIYEFKDPSSYTHVTRDTKENKPPGRVSRRHSTMPHEPTPEDSEASDLEVTRKQETHPSRRRQSSLAMKSSSSRNDPPSKDMNGGERGVKRSTSTVGTGETVTAESRNERISARRRSMML